MTQAQRDRVMGRFRKSGLEFLVATDIAARGIDVDDIQVVFNYDLPYDGEDYVHRIGRTGRAGRAGRAISFVAGRELFQIRNIERYTNTRIQRAKIPTVDEVHEVRASLFLDKLRVTLTGGKYKKQDHLIERLLEEGFNSTDIASALIHHLQGGDAAPAKPAPSEKPVFERPDRLSHREGRNDRGSRFEDRPPHNARFQDDRRERSAYRETREQRPPLRRELSVAPAPVKATPTAPITAATSIKPAVLPTTEAPLKREPRPPHTTKRPNRSEPWPAAKPKTSRATPVNFTRLYINLGAEHGIATGDIVGAILGETGLPAKTVGVIDFRKRHAFVDVAAEHVNGIIAKLNRAQIKGNKVKIKMA
jgi:ATP-dependent RNA helicase DeaD